MKHKKGALAAVSLALAIAAAGGGLALAATSGSPAAQLNGSDVYACVSASGQVDYLEFRLPIPHPCWQSGETLWRWSVNPTPGPTVTASSG
jgi:hypothetical protein